MSEADIRGFEDLAAQVQRNCDIADARHGAELTLCTYLLQMREFFRWERGLALGTALPRAEVGAWIAEREARWEELEGEPFALLRLGPARNRSAEQEGGSPSGSELFDPFDADAVNARLAGRGLVYGAGWVSGPRAARPVFFLASLVARGERSGLAVLQAGTEHARTLLAPPAALAGAGAGPVLLRRESMARWCWEHIEAFALRPHPGGALHAMIEHYGLGRDFHAALPRWLDDQCEIALAHEIGEHRVGAWLGPAWAALRDALAEPRARTLAGALRDQLADLTRTLPALLQHGEPGPLHAWFAGYDGARQALFPSLADGYAAWRGGDGGARLRAQVAAGRSHFEALAQSLLALWAERGTAAAGRIAESLLGAEAVLDG